IVVDDGEAVGDATGRLGEEVGDVDPAPRCGCEVPRRGCLGDGAHQRTRSRTEAKFDTAAPPILKTPASSGDSIWMPGERPVSWAAARACMDTPVAPMGWPLALSPPEGLTGSRPPTSVAPSSSRVWPWPG